MDRFTGTKINRILAVLCAVCFLMVGCKNDSPRLPSQGATEGEPVRVDNDPATRDGIGDNANRATTIIRQMLTRYAAARTYQDSGVLYLSYRLNGQYLEEPQQWSTAWDRDGNRLAVQVFNSRIVANGGLMSCFVFDIETGNLDNQHRLTAYDTRPPLDELYRDSIAKHFLGGYSELPLDETDIRSTPKLIPAPISLLTDQVRSGWLQDPRRVRQQDDETIDGIDCYVVRCLSNDMTADVWIAKETQTLIQMSLPLKLLAGEVITTPEEITDVVLLARFHDAQLDGLVNDDLFTIPLRSDSTPVKKFVPLPDAFPSEMIGKQAPEFRLLTPVGETRTKQHFDGQITALMWVTGEASYSAMEQLNEIANNLPDGNFHLATVYTDSELKQPGSGSYATSESFAAATQKTNLAVYYDINLTTSSALGIKVIPSVILLGEDSKIHFVQALSEKTWPADLKAALLRVAAGNDVAQEMKKEYGRFIESYHQQLETVSASDLALDSDSPVAPDRARVQRLLRPTKIWTNSEFKQAGNVTVLESIDSDDMAFLVFDGWQTVVEVSKSGKTLERHELKLSNDEGTSQIRLGQLNHQPVYALFGPLSKRVHLFSQDWQLISVYPADESALGGINDCQFVDPDSNGNSKLLVSFDGNNGIHELDLGSGQNNKVSTVSGTSIACLNTRIVVTAGGKISLMKTGRANTDATELSFRHLASIGGQHLCGLGKTASEHWNAIGLNSELQRTWTLSIGPQLFENGINSISAARTAEGGIIWAVADAENIVHLISGTGKWLGEFHSQTQLSGIGLKTVNQKTFLVTASETGLECWDLNL